MRVSLNSDSSKTGTVDEANAHVALNSEGKYDIEESRITVQWDDGTKTNLPSSDTTVIADE